MLGLTPLHCASDMGFVEVARWLIAVSHSNHTVLEYVGLSLQLVPSLTNEFSSCCFLSVSKPLQKGASRAPLSEHGKTPLHCTCLNGHVDMARWLIAEGADVNQICADGSTALHFACHNGSIELVKLLLEQVNLHVSSVPVPHIFKWRILCHSQGANISIANERGETPIFWACENGSLPVIEFLVSVDASLHLLSANGGTLMHHAAARGHVAVCQYLLSAGLHVDAIDSSGKTPLFYAAQNAHYEAGMWLIQHNASLSIRSAKMATVMHCACDGGNSQLVQVLDDCVCVVSVAFASDLFFPMA